MRPSRDARRRFLLFALKVRRRDVRGFAQQAGRGAGRDKLLRLPRRQQKALCARYERRQARAAFRAAADEDEAAA